MPDKYIVGNLNKTINESIDYYNDVNEFNLKNKRLKNAQMFEGKHLQEHKLYRHQTPYMDNEMFVGMDAIVAYVCARSPRAEVYPASDTKESRVLARNLENYLQSHADKFELSRKMEGMVYNGLQKYVGFLKLRWDPYYGKNGEVVPEVIDPNHVIVDKNAKMGENPRFICHVLKDTIEGLISKFPNKEADILRAFTIQRKGPKNVTAEVVYREVWFTYWDAKHKPQEAVAWYTMDVVLDKVKNPNWLYGNEGENFLDMPMKPFIPFNIVNDGSHWIDKTSAVEQATAQQDILNKVGRQNVDNIATANGFKILDSHAMRSEDAQNFTGDPNQLLLVKTKPGQTVRDVVAQLPPQLISQQAIAMVADNRNTIHNILGTPSQFRGDDDDLAKTATTNLMVKNQASGRQDKIVRAIDSAMDKYFKLLVQMMCVWYSEKHYATINGGDGNFDFIEMHRDKIESGMMVKVQSGTTLPFDKAREEAVAQNAAELGLLAPYDYFRLMHMDNPQKLYDNLMKWKSAPDQLAMDIANNDADEDAMVDFTELMAGKEVKQRPNPSADYVEQMRQNMITDEFLKAKKSIQNKVVKFVQKAANSLAVRTELEQMSQDNAKPAQPQEIPAQIMQTMQPMVPPQIPMQPPMMGQPPMGQPQTPMSPIQSIMQTQAPGTPPPNLAAQPNVNLGNPSQLPPF